VRTTPSPSAMEQIPELNSPAMIRFPYVYRWNRMDRKGQHLRVLARGRKMNSVLVEFEDGYLAVTSGNALKKRGEWPRAP
jgi:hypothetical protein